MEFAPLSLEDSKPWAALLATSFDRLPVQMEQLLFWFHNGFKLVAWGAWDGPRLVAQYNCRLLELELPGRPQLLQAGMGLNMAVHPEYRGQGLLDKVSRPVHERITEMGCVAGVGFSNALGAKVSRSSSHYDYTVLGKMISTLIWLSRRRVSETITLSDQWPTNPLSFARPDDSYIRYAVTPDSIRHRFSEHPFRRYQFGIWALGEATRGIVVYRVIQIGPVMGAALLAAYGDDLGTLLQNWAATIRQTGVHFVHVLTSPGSPLRNLFGDLGTHVSLPYSRSPYYLIARRLISDAPSVLFDLARWDCTGGDIL